MPVTTRTVSTVAADSQASRGSSTGLAQPRVGQEGATVQDAGVIAWREVRECAGRCAAATSHPDTHGGHRLSPCHRFTASCGKSTQAWGAGRAGSQPCLQMLRHPHAARPPHGSTLSWEAGVVEHWAVHMEIQGPSEGAGLPVASQGRAALPCGSHMSPLLPRPGCQ